MSRRVRPGDRYTVDDAGLYPPPIGDFPRGRPRSRTLGEDPLSSYPGVGTTPQGFTEEPASPRRNHARDGYATGRGPGVVEDRRPEPRRWVDPTPPESDYRPRNRESKHSSPPRYARAGDVSQYEYESAPPRRAKSIGGRRLPEQSPPRYRRYESPEPIQRPRYAARHEPRDTPRDAPRDIHRDAPRDAPRDIHRDAPRNAPRDTHRDTPRDMPRDVPRDAPRDARYTGRYDDYERSERPSPRDRGPDPRRVRTTHVPAYEDGYRPQPRRRGSLDGMDRGYPPRRPYRGRSPSPGPGPRPRHRSVPPKAKETNKQSVLAGIAWQNIAKTALTAGAQAAFKARKDPSPWLGEKGARVATAAIGAAIVNGFIGTKNPDKIDSKKPKGLKKANTLR